jgi:hypothetical protein
MVTRPVIRDALRQTHKIAIGQLIMQGREHLVGIKAWARIADVICPTRATVTAVETASREEPPGAVSFLA